jgi:hypothetical protein
MKVDLINVGRGKVNRTIEIPDGSTPDQIAEDIAEEAKQHLRSTEISATWDTETGEGSIFAGFHLVGKAKVTESKSSAETKE